MATTFSDIIDVALVTIQDYKLNSLYQTNPEDFQTITNAFLLRGLPQFTNCKTPLTYDMTTQSFTNTLTPLEISILADLWVYEWFEWHVQNVTQFENKRAPSDFKHYSEAENLKQKSEYLDKLREKYSQKMVDYGLLNVDWATWGNGNF